MRGHGAVAVADTIPTSSAAASSRPQRRIQLQSMQLVELK